MERGDKGFTIMELMVTIACLFFILMGVMTLFTDVLGYYKQQGKLAESGVERLVGFELFRQDIELAGYGIPWRLPPGFSYNEAASGVLNDAPSSAPRGIVCVKDGGFNGSDRLVIKSAAVGTAAACRQWTLLADAGDTRTWAPGTENLSSGDRVVVLAPGSTEDTRRTLVTSGGVFGPAFASSMPGFASPVPGETRVVYGVFDNTLALRMPFNRAEYFVDTATVPARCAPNTGVLVKGLVRHDNGNLDGTPLPLLDCVAAMEIRFGRDTDGDGNPDITIDGDAIAALDAATIRKEVREVRVSILAQEGQRDPDFTHSPATIAVGPENYTLSSSADPGVDQRHYRWRVHTLVVKTINLGE